MIEKKKRDGRVNRGASTWWTCEGDDSCRIQRGTIRSWSWRKESLPSISGSPRWGTHVPVTSRKWEVHTKRKRKLKKKTQDNPPSMQNSRTEPFSFVPTKTKHPSHETSPSTSRIISNISRKHFCQKKTHRQLIGKKILSLFFSCMDFIREHIRKFKGYLSRIEIMT